jgi:adenylate cyclase
MRHRSHFWRGPGLYHRAFAARAPTVRETREQAVAFVDLADSTRLFRELGDALARDLTHDFYGRVEGVLPRYAGRLVKTLGDGVMCAFPDPDHAVLAMSELHANMSAAQVADQQLRVHSGVSYGSVITEGEDMFGTTVNISAYLAAIARTDQILATQTAVDRLSPAMRACARAAYTARLKGDDAESLVHEIVWQADRAEITDLNPQAVGLLPADEGALQLRFGGELYRLNAFQHRLSIGRDARNGIVVSDSYVSRVHALVEVDTIRFKLIDRSANGTYVAIDGTPGEMRVLRGETVLLGSGRISLGRSFSDPRVQPIAFRRDARALYRV